MSDSFIRKMWLEKAGWSVVSLAITYCSMKYLFLPLLSDIMNAPDPKEADSKRTARSSLQRHCAAQRRPVPETNAHEDRLIADLVFPDQLDTSLDDIGGLEQLKQEMYETVILPLKSPHILAAMQRSAALPATLASTSSSAPSASASVSSSSSSSSSLLAAPRGVLLYGPPGCGQSHTRHTLSPLPPPLATCSDSLCECVYRATCTR